MAIDLTPATLPRRVTVVTPDTRVDLALPTQATVAEVVVQVVALVAADAGDAQGTAGGWSLSRLGSAPLEPGRTVLAADVRDGDVLYLSPRSARLPAALFDDVVDAIAEATSNRPDRWSARTTRHACIAAACLVAAAGVAALATAGPPWRSAVTVAAVLALTLLASGAALSRAAGDGVAGAAAVFAAMPFATWAAARGVTDDAAVVPTTAAALLTAGAALTLVAVLGALAVADLVPVFGGLTVVGAVGTAAGGAALVLGASAEHVAAVVAVVVTVLLPAFPMLSVRLAGLPLPTVPVDMAEFRRDETPTAGEEMVSLARRGDGVLTALVAAMVAVDVGCAAVLVRAGSRWSTVLVAALSTVLLLHGRQLLGRLQRLVLLVPGMLGWLTVAAAVLASTDPQWRLVAAPAAGLLGAALVGYASVVPRRGATPYTGRLLDVLEFLAIAALLPVAAAVLGAYARIRGIGG